MDLLEKCVSIFNKIPAKPVSAVLFWGLAISALHIGAQMTWKLVPSPDYQAAWKPMGFSNSSNSETNVDISELKKLSLFGQADKKTVEKKIVAPVITDAPKTSLSVQLTGVVASTSEQNGLAVIDSNGSQETYSLGDKIKGTSAVLKEVFSDRVILANSGRYETLMLDGLKYTPNGVRAKSKAPSSNVAVSRKIDKRKNRRISEQIEEYREQIMQNPAKISDFISIIPKRGNGGLVGYLLNPGKDGQFFKASGLKPNDLAKTLNGYDLTDINQSIEVMGQLPELTQLSVTVERQGKLIEILFSLPQ